MKCFLDEFHVNRILSRGLNSSFISLIPMVEDPLNLGKFRPISLVNSLDKILAKILAKRWSRVLPKVIYERQSAFLGGRSLLHSELVANEVVDETKRKKKKWLVFKENYEKA